MKLLQWQNFLEDPMVVFPGSQIIDADITKATLLTRRGVRYDLRRN